MEMTFNLYLLQCCSQNRLSKIFQSSASKFATSLHAEMPNR